MAYVDLQRCAVTPAQVARVVALLEESAMAWRGLAPLDAAAMAAGAATLRELAAETPRPRRLISAAAKANCKNRLRAWMLLRQEQFENLARPTLKEDIIAARHDLGYIPRAFIEKARPPEWRLRRGRPSKIPR